MKKNRAFVLYTNNGKIVPGSLVVGNSFPKIKGIWYEIDPTSCCVITPFSSFSLKKAFVKYDNNGEIVSGSLVLTSRLPKYGKWLQIPTDLCCISNADNFYYLNDGAGDFIEDGQSNYINIGDQPTASTIDFQLLDFVNDDFI
jgi:hypothetical protein